MLDWRVLGRVMVRARGTIHSAREQVVENTHDRQQQQEKDQVAADIGNEAEEPKDNENGHDGPDEARQAFTSANG